MKDEKICMSRKAKHRSEKLILFKLVKFPFWNNFILRRKLPRLRVPGENSLLTVM